VLDLDAEIAECRRRLPAAAAGATARPMVLVRLGVLLYRRFERTDARADLEEAVSVCREGVSDSAGHPHRGWMLVTLGGVLRARAIQTGAAGDLDEVVTVCRDAVDATPGGDQDHRNALTNLMAALLARFQRVGRDADLDEAIMAGRRAIGTPAIDPLDQAGVLINLQIMLRSRFDRSGDAADLADAGQLGRDALAATAPGQPLRPVAASNLGITLRYLGEHAADPAPLTESIDLLREVVDATPADHRDRAFYLTNLANALNARFARLGTLTDLDGAIACGEAAIADAPDGYSERAVVLNITGIALRHRFGRTGDPADLDEAIRLGQAAVDAVPAGHPDLPAYLNSLGNALRVRFTRTETAEDLDRAIAVTRAAACDVTVAGHPIRSRFLANLSLALRLRAASSALTAGLDEAIDAARQAAAIFALDDPAGVRVHYILGAALTDRFERTGDRADLADALSAFVQGADNTQAVPAERIRAARAAADLAIQAVPGPAEAALAARQLAARLLGDAVRLLPMVARQELDLDDQQHAFGGFGGLASDAAAAALAAGTAGEAAASLLALQLLEQGRAVLFSQIMVTRGDLTGLREHHPGLAARFAGLRHLLNQPGRSDRHHVAAELSALLAEIRDLADFESFALPPTAGDLLSQSQPGPIVTFNVSRFRSDALILTAGGVTAVPLPGLDLGSVTEKVATLSSSLDALPEILGWLWDTAAEPVLGTLGYLTTPADGAALPRVWWAPGGLLDRLPLHAAGRGHGRCVMDLVVSSYTPTIGALSHARRHVARPVSLDGALIIAMPETPGEPRLLNVARETTELRRMLPGSIVLSSESPDHPPATADVLARLPCHTITHFACHGSSDPADPAKSRLLLSDDQTDPLTVARLASADLEGTHLAFLSACSTAVTTATLLLDEAIHLASAFQLAGFPHVIGTLWPVNDNHAAQIALTFYTKILTSPEDPAHALHQALSLQRGKYRNAPSLWASHVHIGALNPDDLDTRKKRHPAR